MENTKSVVEGSKVSIIKENPFVYETPKKKKKSQSVDKGKDKDDEDDTVDLFFRKDGLFKVLQDVGDGFVVYSCHLFVRVGILCRHIFCVFMNANVEMILQQYILRRWMKNLISATLGNKKNKYGEKNVIVENFANEETLIVDHYVYLLSKDEPRLGVFVEKLKLLKKDVEANFLNPPSKNKIDKLEHLVGLAKPPVVDVNNPSVAKTKECQKLRIKGGKEKAIEKSLKGRNSCLLCGGNDHNKWTCPRRFTCQE
uniref:Protein FAR1-related sequence 5 n=1 Tax=Tanacetum cinerariifolium TaxID=118510 RepID=A0A6L2KHZ7_TANCI|nr:protein FAR1-related sequence 5 [Tanacetum cinerariifolium]